MVIIKPFRPISAAKTKAASSIASTKSPPKSVRKRKCLNNSTPSMSAALLYAHLTNPSPPKSHPIQSPQNRSYRHNIRPSVLFLPFLIHASRFNAALTTPSQNISTPYLDTLPGQPRGIRTLRKNFLLPLPRHTHRAESHQPAMRAQLPQLP